MTMVFAVFFVVLIVLSGAAFLFGRRVGRLERGDTITVTPPIFLENVKILTNEELVVTSLCSYKIDYISIESTPLLGRVKFQSDVLFSQPDQSWALVNVVGLCGDAYSHKEIFTELNERIGHWLPKGANSRRIAVTDTVSL
jgi:hypothetical protein